MDIKLDFDVNEWTLDERMDFEDAVKTMTVEQAVQLVSRAGARPDADDAEKAAAMEAMFSIPSRIRAAFVWIAARRESPDMTFADAAKSFTGQDFYDGIASDDEDADPLEAVPEPTTAKSSARSASTSSTPRRKSAN
jgi:hypothetical protein